MSRRSGCLPQSDRVLVFERAEEHIFAPSLLWLAIGDRDADAIRTPLSRLLRRGIEVVHGSVQSIDPLQRTVTANGAEPAPEMTLYPPSRRRHWGKVIFERTWLRRFFL